MKLKTLILAACFAIMAVVTMTPTTAEAAVCGQGQYSATGESPCMRCPKGTSELWRGSKSCSPCPAGKYAAGTGSIVCDRCSGGITPRRKAAHRVQYALRAPISLGGSQSVTNVRQAFSFREKAVTRSTCVNNAVGEPIHRQVAPPARSARRAHTEAHSPHQNGSALPEPARHVLLVPRLRRPEKQTGNRARPALQASTLRREPPPAPPAQAAREAFPAAAPA